MPFRAPRLILPLLLSALIAPAGAPARAETDATAQRVATLGQRYKALAIQQLREGAERRLELAERMRAAQRAARARKAGKPAPGYRIRHSRDEREPVAQQITREAQRAMQQRVGSLATNVRVNNPFTDGPKAGQAEVSLATYGTNVLVAWNDGDGFNQTPYGNTQGWGYSTNDGQSFTDGGSPPTISPGSWTWDSDPVVMVNESNGDFWYCALISSSGQNGIGVVRGRFNGSNFSWDTPQIARAYPNVNVALDKPWMAVDPGSGRVYLTFTAFSSDGQSDTIDVQSTTDNLTWTTPMALSSPSDAGYVQGSRVVVGPSGEVHTTWYAIGQYPAVTDYFRYRRSTNGGTSFSAETTPVSLYSNYGSGAPGFNRPRGITFPSMAVDRTSGPHRGRVYLSWNESVNYFDDNIGYGNHVVDGNGTTPATATQFTLGDSLTGALNSAGTLHYFKFTATAGQTAVFFANLVSSSLDMSMRIFCTDGATRLAYSDPGFGSSNLIVFSFPTSGTYYLRCASNGGSGTYTVWTGPSTPSAGERARDHRDVFVTGSDNGVIWSGPVRASDSPTGFDDWLPELGISADSKVYVAWYDWRDAGALDCGGNSQLYVATSSDGGASFSTLGALSDASSNWTTSFSNIAPNQGDYIGLFAGCEAVYASWGDARDSTVDVYLARYPPGAGSARVTFSSAQTTPESATLAWQAAAGETALAVLDRSAPSGSFTAIDSGYVQPNGRFEFTDTTVVSGTRYNYRLALRIGTSYDLSCVTAVDIPALVIKLAIEPIAPNPTKGPMVVAFTPGTSASARVDLVDIAGRKIQTVETGPLVAGQRSFVSLGIGITIKPGLYFVRISQSGKDASKRVAVVQ